ncbi:hypothetical protein OJAV_G00164300 [Oryzias javanicus]|uniref:Uncharacterized protein n=1 Tax=Oryzias javanicus TaxID=123683 RepID=A0A3S2MAK1_ORYJA|nr:hypothetical protein OJAV_G00164300 [Oryzias javanicus]
MCGLPAARLDCGGIAGRVFASALRRVRLRPPLEARARSGSVPSRRHVPHRHREHDGAVLRGRAAERGLHLDHPGNAQAGTAAGPARRLPVRALRVRLAQLVRLPVLRGGGAVVLRGAPHLLPHAPVPPAGPDPVHQLAADGVLPLLRGRRAHLHRLHHGGGEGRGSVRPHRCISVWFHSHLPDGRQHVDVLQRGLQPPGGVERVRCVRPERNPSERLGVRRRKLTGRRRRSS